MDIPAIDIDAVPLLDTNVGLFGSFAGDSSSANASTGLDGSTSRAAAAPARQAGAGGSRRGR